MPYFLSKSRTKIVCFVSNDFLYKSYQNQYILSYFHLLVLILIFIINFSYKQPSDSSNSKKTPQFTLPLLNKEKKYTYLLVRSTFVSVVTRLSSSKTKPWSLLLFSMFFLYVSLVIFELMLNIALVIVLEGTKSLPTKTLGVVRCFVRCVDLPDLDLLFRRFFSTSW